MPTRNVVLTDHHEDVISRLVESGRYQNASEVLREGLRLIEQRETYEAAKLDALREAIRIGDADLDEGRYYEFATFEDLERHLIEVTEEAIRAAED